MGTQSRPGQLMRIRSHLFYGTSHSPSLVDLVGIDEARTVVDFCFIANPYYPTAGMLDRLVERLPDLIKSYPSSNPEIGAGHLAEVLRVDPANLIIGNGASELITTMTGLIENVAVPIPTFGEYLEKVERARLLMYPLAAETGYSLDLAAFSAWMAEADARAALVINPGNPTGQTFAIPEMEEFLRRSAGLDLVIVDESFIDFAGTPIPTLLHVADQFSNLILVRSMSKHCGVPGLRLGYCYSNNRYLLNRLRRRLPTWNINTLAEFFLSQLRDTEVEYHESRKKVMRDARNLYEQLAPLPDITPFASGANFVLFRIDADFTSRELQMALLRGYRLYVRDCANKVGMDDRHIRVATQGPSADRRLIDALRALSGDPGRVRALADGR